MRQVDVAAVYHLFSPSLWGYDNRFCDSGEKRSEEGRGQVVISPLLGRKKRDDEQLGQ
jgi:hypothetical protein